MRALLPRMGVRNIKPSRWRRVSGNLIACIEPECVVFATPANGSAVSVVALSVITAPSALQVSHRNRLASPHIATSRCARIRR
jgi:TRAP-type mannitol/chloroaromatic compound transport system permease large subunit